MAIFIAGLFSDNGQSRTCLFGWLHERLCTQLLEGGSLHLGEGVFLSELVLPNSKYCIHPQSSHSREVAVHQVLAIPEVVALYIIHSLPRPSDLSSAHAAFLITPTEIILLSSMLSLSVPMPKVSMCTMCKRNSPSTDSILFPPNSRIVRAVKWMWAISFTIVALRL